MSKVFLITGAGRGRGVDFARAALAAGHQVVATGRRPDAVEAPIGADENLLAVQLDVTEPADAEAAVAAAVERSGRIDVESMNGTQAGDPAKLATALIGLIDSPQPPARFLAGADVLAAAEQKARTLLAQADAHRQPSSSLAHDDASDSIPA
jgi:putative NADH-flavin reductase